jgi:triosephosphate isomerase
MRRPVIAGNWKMNTTVDEAVSIVRSMVNDLDKFGNVEKVVCPPFISLTAVKEIIKGTSIKLGAQNMYFEEKGAYTGEISPAMLIDLCEFVILGHSERRQYFGEDDGMVNRKIKAAMQAGLIPVLCVGETLEENEANRTGEILTGQVRRGLAEIDSTGTLIIAYEPIWAIGTGKAANAGQATAAALVIRTTIEELYNSETAQSIRILYGGSVNGSNIAEFISESEIDGALVGGASLKRDDFIEIVRRTESIKRTTG